MNTVLKNIVSFTGLTIGTPVALPHLLNVNGVAVVPKLVLPEVGGATVTADETDVIVTRQIGGPSTLNVYVEYWHSMDAATPPTNLTGQLPFVFAAGTGGSDASVASLPEQWSASLESTEPPQAMTAQIGGGATSNAIKATRTGSVVGIRTTIDGTGVQGGSATVTITINGVAGTLAIVHTATAHAFGGSVMQFPGIDTYNPGDRIALQYQTSPDFEPDEGGADLGVCWVEIAESSS